MAYMIHYIYVQDFSKVSRVDAILENGLSSACISLCWLTTSWTASAAFVVIR